MADQQTQDTVPPMIAQPSAQNAPVAQDLPMEPAAQIVNSVPAPVGSGANDARVYNNVTKEWSWVPAHEVDQVMQSGDYSFPATTRIPMINTSGQSVTLSAEEAPLAIKNGYQYMTPQLSAQSIDARQQAIRQNRFNSPVTALLAGAARTASLGVSDIGLNYLGLGDAAKASAEVNPVGNFLGEAGGAVLPALAGDYAGLAGTLSKTAAGTVTPIAEALLGSSAAANVATKALSAAAEGAVFGFGSGVSEQALGSSNSLYDSLSAHLGTGAMIGGGLGGIFGTAAEALPKVSKLLSSAVDTGSTALKNTARKIVQKAFVNAGMTAEDAVQATSPELIAVVQKHGLDAVENAVRDAKPDIDGANGVVKDFHNNVKELVAGKSADVAQEVAATMQETGNHIGNAVDALYEKASVAKENFLDLAAADKTPINESTANGFTDDIQKVSDVFSKSANPQARSIGRQLDAIIDTHGPITTQGQQLGLALKVRNAMRQGITNTDADQNILNGLSATEKRLVNDTVQTIDNLGDTYHPRNGQSGVQAAYKQTVQTQDAAEIIKKAANQTIAKSTTNILPGQRALPSGGRLDPKTVLKTLADPSLRATVKSVMQNLSGLAPEAESAAQGFKTLEDKIQWQDGVAAKLKSLDPNSNATGDQIHDALTMIGSDTSKYADIQAYTKAAQSANPMDQILAARRLQNLPISDDLKTIADQQKAFDIINQSRNLRPIGVKPPSTRTYFAGQIAGGLGIPGLRKVVTLASMIGTTSTAEQIAGLARLSSAAESGAQKINRAIDLATKGIVSSPVQTIAKSIGYTKNAPSMDTAKDTYKKAKQLNIQPPQIDPQLSKIAPQAAQAFLQRQQQVQQYVQQKMPQDPLQATSIMYGRSNYLPSDRDLSSFQRTVQAAGNPLHSLTELAQGRAAPETVDALKTLHPEIYQNLQNAVLDKIIKDKPNLSYSQKLSISNLFGIPTDYSLQPDFIQRMQASYSAPEAGRPQGAKTNQRTVKIDISPETTVASEATQTAYGLNKED